MRIHSPDKSELMLISAIEPDGDCLTIKGRIFGAMPMTARISPEQARQGLKLLKPSTVLFLLGFLFRRSS